MTDYSQGDRPSLDRRVADLESAVARLADQVARLEAALAPRRVERLRPLPRPPLRPPAPEPRAAPRKGLDFERLVGRYGAIGFALLALLTGVGTFVSWAARQGLLGPELRVAGGYLLSVALAVAGVRLRATRRTFANALLACALGCVHAASWGAGPRLHLISSGTALAIVAAASAALAWLAVRESEDVLFLFGAGGAAVAPFVVRGEGGASTTLALYGALVFIAAARGVGARPWHTAVRLVLWFVPVYLAALAAAGGPRPLDWSIPLFSAGVWGAALLAAPVHAPRFARWGAIGFLVAALDLAGATDVPVALALVAMVGARILLTRADRMVGAEVRPPDSVQLLPVLPTLSLERRAIDRVLLPLSGLIVVAKVTPLAWLDAVDAGARTTMPALAAWGILWAVGAAVAAAREGAEVRSGHWTATVVFSLLAGAFGLAARTVPGGVAYAIAAAFAMAGWWRRLAPPRALDGALALALLGGLLATWELVAHSEGGVYGTPFTSRATLGGAVAVAGALALIALIGRKGGAAAATARRTLTVGTALFAFVWGLAELRVAWSHDLSNALLTLYVGVVGAIAIGIGIVRNVELLRRAGLLLGGWCALRTFALAGDVSSLPLRVSLYFLAAAIGLVMAWMYTGGWGLGAKGRDPGLGTGGSGLGNRG